MKLKNLRPFAVVITPIDLPDIDVDGGAVFEVDDRLGRDLLKQEDNYERVDKPSPKKEG